ncbi:hypothetical protein IPJ70_03740 [Candidatus Campbellbacteria bacterium]|nr:MAG: hypothetical protein IPJ70_03740 [Candidatus Campbellbacteria bacterium]
MLSVRDTSTIGMVGIWLVSTTVALTISVAAVLLSVLHRSVSKGITSTK